MKNKIIILALVIICFIAFPINTVTAADEEYTFDDGAGDVFDEEFEKHPEVQDIDMNQIVYSKTGKTVNLDINFVGNFRKLSSLELVIIVYLYTSGDEYQILYLYSSLFENITGSNLNGDFINVEIEGFNTQKITLTFDLGSEDETYEDIIVSTAKADIQQTYAYTDIYPNEEFLDVDAQGDNKGEVGESLSFTGTASGGTPPYSYEWDFGDGEISEEQNPTHKYEDAGTYDVTLYVMDGAGVEGIDFFSVTISGENGGNGNGENGSSDDSNTGIIIFIVLIVIIVVVGLAVVFFVIKK
jgi:hypothetical protein